MHTTMKQNYQHLIWTTALLWLASVTPAAAQHPAHDPDPHTRVINRHAVFPHVRVAGFISHTFIPSVVEGDRFAIPSYGLDLEYWFTDRVGLGLHNDIELESFVVQRGPEEFVERDYPIVSTLDLLLKPWKGLAFQVGPGVEFDQNEHYYLLRLGVEYEVELAHHWDIYPTFFFDNRTDGYTTFSIGLGVGKRL